MVLKSFAVCWGQTLLDIAVQDPAKRLKMQALFDKQMGDLTFQEDRYWDLQAEAMLQGVRMVDQLSSLRMWTDAKARGYGVIIDRHRFDELYALDWTRLERLKVLVGETVKAITTPPTAPAPPAGKKA